MIPSICRICKTPLTEEEMTRYVAIRERSHMIHDCKGIACDRCLYEVVLTGLAEGGLNKEANK